MPAEYGFAIRFPGDYSSADVDAMLAKVKEQWEGFEPLSKEFREDYTARLNNLIKQSDPAVASSVSVSSVKPVLASIDRLDAGSYSVVSVRSYALDVNGERVTQTKVNADAVVLRGASLIRLTIQRALHEPADVERLRSEVGLWARAIETSASSTKDTGRSLTTR